MNKIRPDIGVEKISPEIKDSLIHLKATGLLPILHLKISAIEQENNSSLEWIIHNGKSQVFEELLYRHPNVVFKVIGVKGLIRRNDRSLLKHVEYAFTPLALASALVPSVPAGSPPSRYPAFRSMQDAGSSSSIPARTETSY